MNDLDARIRAAVTELAEAAPPPRPLPATATDPDRSYRWLAAAAAGVLIVTGVVAIATWQSTRDDRTPLDTVATSTPGDTLAPPPTSSPTTPDTTTPTATPRTIPVGEIAAGPGDVLAVDGSGAIVLIGMDSNGVVPPVTLAAPDGARPQNIQVAGLVDGTVLYGVGDGSTRAVMVLTAPGATPIELATSVGGPWISPDGEQWATIDPSGGQLVIRRTDGSPGATIELDSIASVAWSPDGASMYLSLSDSGLSWLRRYTIDDGYRMTGEVEAYQRGFHVAGFDASGKLVVDGFRRQDESTVVTTYSPDSLETADGVWDRTIPASIAQVALSPDGSRLMTVALAGGATIEDLDGTTVRLDGVTSAWFVGGVLTYDGTGPARGQVGVVAP